MEILKNTFFMQGLLAAGVIGMIVKLIVWRSYHNLLTASLDMDRPRKRWIGILKKKFENYYQLDAHLNNIPCIVDKYFQEHKVLGISISILEQIPGFCGVLCILLGCIGCIRGIHGNMPITYWIQSFMVSAGTGLILFMLDNLLNPEHMKRSIRANLIHFLENVLPNRMEKEVSKKEKKKELRQEERQQQKQEKQQVEQIAEQWGQIASARELTLTQEEIQAMKDFINDL